MAFFDTTWYVNSVGYTAVALRPRNTAVTVGMIRRPATAPALNSERVYVCTFAGTTADVADATWVFTHAAVVIDGTCSWLECTGTSAMNGDLANTPTWAKIKTGTTSVGVIIKRANGASYQVITTNGTVGAAEPAFSDTPGATTADGTVTWTCLGPVGNFLGGKAPHARLSNAFTTNWADSGDTIYIGHNHSEVQSTNMTIGANNSTLITKTLCHNAAGSYPPTTSDLTTGALVATDQGGTIQVPASAGSYYFYGITFRAGSIAMPNAAVLQLGSNSSATTQLSNWYSFENCLFQIGGSGICCIGFGSSGAGSHAVLLLNNCTVKFADVTQYIWPTISNTTWSNTGLILAAGSAVPNSLFQFLSGSFMANVFMEGLDLSQITRLSEVTTSTTTGRYTLKDCKLHPTMTVGAPKASYHTVQLVRSASDATAYKSSRITYEGTETTETTIVRTDGYADPAGRQQSRKIVTTAYPIWMRPYTTQTTDKWNYVVGAAVAVTMYGTIQAAALPTTDDIWVEVGYVIPTNLPLGGVVTSTKAHVWNTEVSPVAADASTWGGGGSGAGWLPFKLTATVPSTISSFLIVRVCVAKPSMTCYIDPTPVLS